MFLVITDLDPGNADIGLELAQGAGSIPLLIATGLGPGDQSCVSAEACFPVLTKPFDQQALDAALLRIIACCRQ